jgi:hypothetical protein
VTLGFENRNKAIAVVALLVVAVVVVVWELWPASSSASAKTPIPSPTQNITNGKKGSTVASTLDPTLRFNLLRESEGTKYEGSGKNIFVAAAEPIPQPIASPVIAQQPPVQQGPPQPPPPPPINLKFYGFAAEQGGVKQIFLAKDDAIFIAKEGDIVDRRYKVLHIYPMAVEIEDVLNNNIQQIPLTQG